MKFLIAVVFLFSFAAFADDVSECREIIRKKHAYIEEIERCQGVLLRHSIEKFNNFSETRAPAIDCQEAKDNSGLVNSCRNVGIDKVKEQARTLGLKVRDQDVYACDVDNNWISDYVWFCAETPKGEIRKLTQKPLFKDCF
jgi:hypothetical protein